MTAKPRPSRTFAILAGLLLGLLAAGIVFLIILANTRSQVSDIKLTVSYSFVNETTIALGVQTATVAAQRTPSDNTDATMVPCAWSWASRDEPELTAEFQNIFSQLTTLEEIQTITLDVITQGEDCNRPNATPTYGIMNTVIRLDIQLGDDVTIENLDMAYDVLVGPALEILQTFVTYPLDNLPGTQVRLEISFLAGSGSDQTAYFFSGDDRIIMQVLEQDNLSSRDFFEQLGGLEAR